MAASQPTGAPNSGQATEQNLYEEFHRSFVDLFGPLRFEFENPPNPSVENHRAAVEHLVPKFADNARAMELYFVRWKTIFGNLNPDELVKEEICEMEAEIRRKDALLAKIYEKLGEWKTTFAKEAMEQKKDQNEDNASLLN